ncbi:ATP-binding protein [Bacillus sp. 1P10SD]|uniref:ATP-binding protein n=1 Tax=Bacillus sp. 1P10SD TaxID=3132265 RepID=UPI0039A64C5C
MLAEKLLLNVLITIAPVLLSSTLMDNNRKFKSPYLCGFLQSIAAITCMLFSYANYGFHWDLRYVPLVLAILYGGPVAGGIVLSSIIGTRLILGGGTMIFGLSNSVLTALIPFLLLKIFWRYSPKQRVVLTMLAGVWSLTLCFLSLNIFRYLEGNFFKLDFNLPDLILVGSIQTLALGLAAKLNEGIIERNQMQKEIQRAEKLNTLGELAASFAHEVRNPLTVVKGFLQLMQREESGKNYQYLSLVLNELARAELIINDYLNFAKPQFEKVEEFSLREVLAEVVILMEPLAAKQGVQLHSELESNRFSLVTDRNQFKQALVNLIKNGIEATPEGGKVTVHSNSNDYHATVKIADTGKGMTEEQIARIGTLFYTTKDKGTGLGTSVSLKIIQTMNGKISYHSVLGVGTEVTLVLPEGKKEEMVMNVNAS